MDEPADPSDVRRSVADALTRAITRIHPPTPSVSDATRAARRARARQLDEIADAIAAGEHLRGGHRSPTDWLAATTHESIGHCRSTVMLVDRLRRLPAIAAAFHDGAVAESAVRLLAEAWHPELAEAFARDEHRLLDWATTLPHRDLRLVVDTWRHYVDHDHAADAADDRFERRGLRLAAGADGLGRLDGVLDPEGLALVREAIRALSAPAEIDTRTVEQRRADALVDMARLTLDALAEPAPTEPAEPGRRHKRNRPTVLATIALTDLITGSGGGVLDTHLDTVVASAETIRRLCCDAGIHRYVSDPAGTVVDHGRRQRTVTDRQFERLHIRDHHCRWPGCGSPAGACDAHHAHHWLDLGPTDDDNLVLLCWYHHHLLHEQHWSLEPLGAGHFTLHDPDGCTHPMRPPLIGLTLHVPPLPPPVPAERALAG